MKATCLDMSNPITRAVLPLKEEAQRKAMAFAQKLIVSRTAELEAAGWNLDIVAPYPRTVGPHAVHSRKEYQTMKSRRDSFSLLFPRVDNPRGGCYSSNDAHIVRLDEARAARFVENAVEIAGLQYDAFVAKLAHKIGACVTAELNGSHVWGHSVLTVTKADSTVERWKTQTIINVSKLGTVFNQWPSRKLK